MIHIEKGQSLTSDPTLRVATVTGDYEDSALIECYGADGDTVVGAYQAQYIKYGDLVYRFNDPVDLGKAILAADPQATHSAASYVRMTEELLVKMNTGALEPESLDQVIATEQAATEELRTENPESQVIEEEDVARSVQDEVSDTPPTTSTPVSTDVSSTTPSVLGASTEATSTPAAPSVLEHATSTLEQVRSIETPATSTPTVPEILVPEATSTPEALRKGGKKIAKVMRRSRG